MMRKIRWILAAASTLAIGAAFEMPASGEETVDAAQKISRLRQASRELSELARQPIPAGLAPEEKRQAGSYTRWLEEASAQLDDLADRWAKALKIASADTTKAEQTLATNGMQELNTSFSMQYLAIQQKIQAESREYAALSNIMKAKHDAAKNAINNIR
jgi:hypothetical protein